ncbi:MAG: S-layer homology domain-containing protein [Oscillospiraceae bacterium]|nr:S-layer homology domain-containing protein [Oscillospiraceae bacterium]
MGAATFSFLESADLIDNYVVLIIGNKVVDGKHWIYVVSQNNLLGDKTFTLGFLRVYTPLSRPVNVEVGGRTALNRSIVNVDMQVFLKAYSGGDEPTLPEVTVPTLEPSPDWWPSLPEVTIEERKLPADEETSETAEIPAGSAFTDIDDTHWAYDAMALLAEITPLYPKNGDARPSEPVTRAEFAYLMCLIFGITQSNNDSFFSDVTSEMPYVREINTLAEIGIVSGVGESIFLPDGNITREGAALMIFRIIGEQRSEKPCDLRDVEAVSDWAKTAVKNLNTCGIISGDGEHNFNPKAKITRAGAAVLIVKSVMAAAKQFVG